MIFNFYSLNYFTFSRKSNQTWTPSPRTKPPPRRTARKSKPKTPAQKRKEEEAANRARLRQEKYVARELANAAKFAGAGVERRETRSLTDDSDDSPQQAVVHDADGVLVRK